MSPPIRLVKPPMLVWLVYVTFTIGLTEREDNNKIRFGRISNYQYIFLLTLKHDDSWLGRGNNSTTLQLWLALLINYLTYISSFTDYLCVWESRHEKSKGFSYWPNAFWLKMRFDQWKIDRDIGLDAYFQCIIGEIYRELADLVTGRGDIKEWDYNANFV